MCVIKDLSLDKEGIGSQRSWTLKSSIRFGKKKLTKDLNGDGNWINLGAQNTPERSLGGKMRSFLRWHAQADSSRSERVFDFSAKLKRSNKNYKVSSKGFDQGKVALSHDLAQYRTYKTVSPTSRFLNIQTSPWTCIPMPAKSKTTGRDKSLRRLLFAMSGSSSHSKLAWELMQIPTDPEIQQTPLAQSQGISVMPAR